MENLLLMVGKRDILRHKGIDCGVVNRKGDLSRSENLVDDHIILRFDTEIHIVSSFRGNELRLRTKLRSKMQSDGTRRFTKSGCTTPTDDYITWERLKKQYGISYADLHGPLNSLTEGIFTTSKGSSAKSAL